MKTYNYAKQVQAAKILTVDNTDKSVFQLTTDASDSVRLSDGSPVDLRYAVLGRRWEMENPVAGDYLVLDSRDGISWVPAHAFERDFLESAEPTEVVAPRMQDIGYIHGQPDGHIYTLAHLGTVMSPVVSHGGLEQLQFICKRPKVGGAPGELETVAEGTTNEAVMEVLIDRMQKLYAKFPSEETALSIRYIQEALRWQEIRTAKRKAAGVEGKQLHVPGERVTDPKLYGVSVTAAPEPQCEIAWPKEPTEEDLLRFAREANAAARACRKSCDGEVLGAKAEQHLLNDVPAMSLYLPSAVVAEGFCRMLDAHREASRDVFGYIRKTCPRLSLSPAELKGMALTFGKALLEEAAKGDGTLITSRLSMMELATAMTGRLTPAPVECAVVWGALTLQYDDDKYATRFTYSVVRTGSVPGAETKAKCNAATDAWPQGEAQLNTAASICAANEPSEEDKRIISQLLEAAEKATLAEDNPQAVS